MPKYLLLKHYSGGPTPHENFVPMDQGWSPEDIAAHIDYQRQTIEMLRERGEYVDAQALSPEGAWVRFGGEGAAPVKTDGPYPEAKELVAGWFMIDVDSEERAHEVAAFVSKAPGKGGAPIYEWIQVRLVMAELPDAE